MSVSSIAAIIFCFCFLCIHAQKPNTVNVKNSRGITLCPTIQPQLMVDIDKLLGDWHLALVILDETGESIEERSICIQGKILKVNNTLLLQVVTVDMPEILHQHNTQLDFLTTIVMPGIWLVQSPFGGELKGIVIKSTKSNLIMMYCGWYEGVFMHLGTLALTRENTITSIQRLQLLSSLVKTGYDPYNNKIISWRNC